MPKAALAPTGIVGAFNPQDRARKLTRRTEHMRESGRALALASLMLKPIVARPLQIVAPLISINRVNKRRSR